MTEESELVRYFSPVYTVPDPVTSETSTRDIDKLGMIGAAALRDRGFFTRIVSGDGSPARRLMKPQNVRVMIVEDDESTGDLIEHVLHAYGCKTLRARNREEIASGLAVGPYPHLILLDVLMPDADGFEVLNKIRHHPELMRIPVLMVTALGERKHVIRGLTIGANGYITKPVTPSVLMEAVETVLAG